MGAFGAPASRIDIGGNVIFLRAVLPFAPVCFWRWVDDRRRRPPDARHAVHALPRSPWAGDGEPDSLLQPDLHDSDAALRRAVLPDSRGEGSVPAGVHHGVQHVVLTLTVSAGGLASFVSVPPAAEGVVSPTAAVRQLPRLRLASRRRRLPQDRRAELLLQLQPPRGLQTGQWKQDVVSVPGKVMEF